MVDSYHVVIKLTTRSGESVAIREHSIMSDAFSSNTSHHHPSTASVLDADSSAGVDPPPTASQVIRVSESVLLKYFAESTVITKVSISFNSGWFFHEVSKGTDQLTHIIHMHVLIAAVCVRLQAHAMDLR